jgi:hypothetical protein
MDCWLRTLARELVKLPLSQPAANRVLRSATFSLDKRGNLKGSIEEVRKGAPAMVLRESLLNLPNKKRQKVFQNMLADLIDGALLTGAGVSDLKAFDGSLSLRYELTVPAYAQRTGNLFLFRSCVLGRKSPDMLEGKPRKEPIAFPHTSSESDVVDISFPAEYTIEEIPQAVKYESPFAAYKSETHSAEGTLHYVRTYELKDVRVPVEHLDDLKVLFRNMADDERAYAILKVP